MKIAIKNIEGKSQGELEVKFELIETGKGTQAVHDTVVAYNAAQRSGTACVPFPSSISRNFTSSSPCCLPSIFLMAIFMAV